MAATTKERSLYNGVSNRSRGWKTRKPANSTERRQSLNLNAKRWDGASRTSVPWDSLRRDPELWYRDGDCCVHLYGYGQSRRGPAFRVPLAPLLQTNSYPFIERFIVRDLSTSAGLDAQETDRDSLSSNSLSHVDLYIPAPPGLCPQEVYDFHLAARNYFAFVFRRSLVGEHLGTAIITLLYSMIENRTGQVDNIEDLMDYLDEEGYLHLAEQPVFALAILHLGETFQLEDIYTDAFAHCCGMSDDLFKIPEYQLLSSPTRNLIRRARQDMDTRLTKNSQRLRTFLQDELSEAYLGLSSGGRAHLERFRTVLHGLYASKLGYYPPFSLTTTESTFFSPDACRVMMSDFEELYNYLVDREFEGNHSIPFAATGGMCTWQTLQTFDVCCNYRTQNHALPLLPKLEEPNQSRRRSSWLKIQTKPNPKQQLNTYAALVRATNKNEVDIRNDLVQAYRRFEEDTVLSPSKADKLENLGVVEARKVRWILIYSVYQTLQQTTAVLPQVRQTENLPYHLCISSEGLPPWNDQQSGTSSVRQRTTRSSSNAASTNGSIITTESPGPIPSILPEIKPDIDYFAITHRDVAVIENEYGITSLERQPTVQRSSLARSLTRSYSSNKRRSWGLFSRQQQSSPVERSACSPRRRSSYHEIVVHGYGNGTNSVQMLPEEISTTEKPFLPEPECLSPLAIPTPSDSSDFSASDYSNSDEGSAETARTSVENSPVGSPRIPEEPSDSFKVQAITKGRGQQGSHRDAPQVSRHALSSLERRTVSYHECMRGPYDEDEDEERREETDGLSPLQKPRQTSWPGPALPTIYAGQRAQSVRNPTVAAGFNALTPNSNILPRKANSTSTRSPSLLPPLPSPLQAKRQDQLLQRQQQQHQEQMQALWFDEDDEAIMARRVGMREARAAKAVSLLVGDVKPEWEQYSDLGGLTDVTAVRPGKPAKPVRGSGSGSARPVSMRMF